jgi:hypothetical protein
MAQVYSCATVSLIANRILHTVCRSARGLPALAPALPRSPRCGAARSTASVRDSRGAAGRAARKHGRADRAVGDRLHSEGSSRDCRIGNREGAESKSGQGWTRRKNKHKWITSKARWSRKYTLDRRIAEIHDHRQACAASHEAADNIGGVVGSPAFASRKTVQHRHGAAAETRIRVRKCQITPG